jgi:hypothetical protein
MYMYMRYRLLRFADALCILSVSAGPHPRAGPPPSSYKRLVIIVTIKFTHYHTHTHTHTHTNTRTYMYVTTIQTIQWYIIIVLID